MPYKQPPICDECKAMPPMQWLRDETNARSILVGKVDCKGAATMSDEEFWGKVDETLREGVLSRAFSRPHATQSGQVPEARDTRELLGQRW